VQNQQEKYGLWQRKSASKFRGFWDVDCKQLIANYGLYKLIETPFKLNVIGLVYCILEV
jgi:hypothetical protein